MEGLLDQACSGIMVTLPGNCQMQCFGSQQQAEATYKSWPQLGP